MRPGRSSTAGEATSSGSCSPAQAGGRFAFEDDAAASGVVGSLPGSSSFGEGAFRPAALFVFLLVASGGALLAFAYHLAAGGARPFYLLWFSFALMFVPLSTVACLGPERFTAAALAALAVVSAAPRVLRSPGRPVFSDEFAHMREINNLTYGWGVDVSNAMVRMASEFPGMHSAVASVADTFGVSTWVAALSVVSAAHALALLAVFHIGRIFVSARSAALAAVVYATNPSFLMFNAQVSYESFALPLALWFVFALLAGLYASGGMVRVAVFFAAAVLLASVVLSHHLTALMLVVFGGYAAVSGMLFHHGPRSVLLSRPALAFWAFLAAAGAALVAWMPSNALVQGLWKYLSPSLRVVTSPPRVPFSGTDLPAFELAAGLALPVVVVAFLVFSFVFLRRSGDWWRIHPAALGVASTAVLLPASFPFVLAVASAEGARRSWAWSYLGFGMLAALVRESWLYRAGSRRTGAVRGASAVSLLSVAVLFVGGVAASQNEAARLPGPWATAVDSRSQPDVVWGLAGVVADLASPGDRVLADRFARGPIAVSAPVEVVAPSDPYPLWDVLFLDAPDEDVVELLVRDVRFVVVDVRMADRPSGEGFWFNRGEPPASRLSPAALSLLDSVGLRVAQAGPYLLWDLSSGGADGGGLR